MQMNGEIILTAKPDAVWKALNDADVLRQSIPGCQSLDKLSGTEFKATVGTRIGPMQVTFNGQVQLSDLDPPHGYTISGSGSGGIAGSAKGGAKVRLEPHAQGTRLTYDVDAQVAGKIAQLGSRLIDSTAKMMAEQFFGKFQEIVGAPTAATETAAAAPAPQSGAIPSWVWLVGGVAAILALILLLR